MDDILHKPYTLTKLAAMEPVFERIAKALLERESLRGDELDVLIASQPLLPDLPALALIDTVACVAERNLGLTSKEVDSAGAQPRASGLGNHTKAM